MRVDGRNWWHWVFQMPAASYHVTAPSRGIEVVTGVEVDGLAGAGWARELRHVASRALPPPSQQALRLPPP